MVALLNMQVVAAGGGRWRNLCRAPAGQEEGGREATKPLTFYSNSLKLASLEVP